MIARYTGLALRLASLAPETVGSAVHAVVAAPCLISFAQFRFGVDRDRGRTISRNAVDRKARSVKWDRTQQHRDR